MGHPANHDGKVCVPCGAIAARCARGCAAPGLDQGSALWLNVPHGMKKYREQWRQIVADAVAGFAVDAGIAGIDTSTIVLETPPRPEMGDIACPLFPFARAFRKAPPAIAAEVARRIQANPAAAAAGSAAAEGPYVNISLSRTAVIDDILRDVAREGRAFGRGPDLAARASMLEFSCPNTNKPLHLGHLRNDAIGASLGRILAEAGATLRRVNLINDRGVHICKSMLAYQMFGGTTTPESEGVKGDHFVGDYYVKYAQYAKDHPEAEEQVRAMLRKWEEGDAETVALWRTMNAWVISGIEQTYQRTGIAFDQVYRESEIYKLGRSEILAGSTRASSRRIPTARSGWTSPTRAWSARFCSDPTARRCTSRRTWVSRSRGPRTGPSTGSSTWWAPSRGITSTCCSRSLHASVSPGHRTSTTSPTAW